MGRGLIIAGVVALAGAVGALVWVVLDLPPPGLVVRHGLPPAGRPTGRRAEIEGVTFLELGPGYFERGSWEGCVPGDLLWTLTSPFGLRWGRPPRITGDEAPRTWVEIPRAFWIAATEVTNAQYARFDPAHAGHWPGEHEPVTNLTWEEACRYCDWLSGRGGLDVRLPTESEWEYAARAGSRERFCHGDDEAGLDAHAWFAENSGGLAHEVGTRRPNAWGLHDMHGNVREWVEDYYDCKYVPPDTEFWIPTGPARGYRAVRGGDCGHVAGNCRSARRFAKWPGNGGTGLGFRPAATPRP